MALRRTLVALAAALAAACAGQPAADPTREAPMPVVDEQIAALVPEAISADGRLTVATDPNYPPLEFLGTDGQVQGADIDLVAAVAAILGLRPQFEAEAFTEIPVAVRSGRYELGAAGLTVRRDRRLLNNAVVYLRAGSQLVRSTSAPQLSRRTLCGAAVAAMEGSVQIEELVAVSRQCRRSGQPSVDIAAFSDQAEATAAVLAGEVSGFLADSPVSQDVVARYPADIEAASRIYDVGPMGMLTAAEYTRFARAVKRALQQLVDTGYYAEVLDRWNIAEGRVARVRIRWAD